MVNTSQITFLLQSKPNMRQHHHHVHSWSERTNRPLKQFSSTAEKWYFNTRNYYFEKLARTAK